MKQINLSKKEEEWIRLQIAVTLDSTYKGEEYRQAQFNLYDDERFIFDKKYYDRHVPLKLMKGLFEKLR